MLGTTHDGSPTCLVRRVGHAAAPPLFGTDHAAGVSSALGVKVRRAVVRAPVARSLRYQVDSRCTPSPSPPLPSQLPTTGRSPAWP